MTTTSLKIKIDMYELVNAEDLFFVNFKMINGTKVQYVAKMHKLQNFINEVRLKEKYGLMKLQSRAC